MDLKEKTRDLCRKKYYNRKNELDPDLNWSPSDCETYMLPIRRSDFLTKETKTSGLYTKHKNQDICRYRSIVQFDSAN